MNATTRKKKPASAVLTSDQAAAILADLKITARAPDPDGMTVLIDAEGRAMFQVPISIDARSLVSILDYAGRQRESGRRAGREQAKDEVRSAIGAAREKPAS